MPVEVRVLSSAPTKTLVQVPVLPWFLVAGGPQHPYNPPLADAGWSSLVARRAHNPKVVGSNPAPATKGCKPLELGAF